jgi:RDD family
VEIEIASRRERVLAGFIDGLLFLPLVVLDWQVAAADWAAGAELAYFLISWRLGWAYTVALHGWRGQTIGKAAVGIRVVRRADRGRLSGRRSRDCGWDRRAQVSRLTLLGAAFHHMVAALGAKLHRPSVAVSGGGGRVGPPIGCPAFWLAPRVVRHADSGNGASR